MINIRELILDILIETESGEVYSNVLVRQVLDKYDYLETQEKAFLKRVVDGSVERRLELDYILDSYSSVPVKKMKPLIRNLLRMSVYQLLYMDAVPDSAVCNEAVKLAEKRKFHTLKGFVNGVLRRIAREKEAISYPDEKKDWKRALCIRASMPMEILDLWEREYGREKTERMVKSFCAVSPVCLRMDENLSETEKEKLIEKWKEQGISLRKHPYLSYAYIYEQGGSVKELPGFSEGLVTVQDVSSMLVSECAGIEPGNLVLDVCAAPGGKSLHAACMLQGTGEVDARDVSPEKTELIREAAGRLRCHNIKVSVRDACVFDEGMKEKADILYLDVPCSGLGVMGRKRDIKYHITQEGLRSLVELQRKIIETCWQYVKPGGIIMYSTCTVRREENEEQVKWMCGEFPLKAESLNKYLPEVLQNEETGKGMLQLFPGVHDCDGFFLARLRRIEGK